MIGRVFLSVVRAGSQRLNAPHHHVHAANTGFQSRRYRGGSDTGIGCSGRVAARRGAQQALLVMPRGGEAASNASAKSVNAEISAECQQFVVATQYAKDTLDGLNRSKRPPRRRFQLCDVEDATDDYPGEAVRLYVD